MAFCMRSLMGGGCLLKNLVQWPAKTTRKTSSGYPLFDIFPVYKNPFGVGLLSGLGVGGIF